MFAFLMILGYVLLIGVIITMFVSNPRKGFMTLGISVVLGGVLTVFFGPMWRYDLLLFF